jgi:hypothetical protein
MERNIERKGSPGPRAARNVRTFDDLVDLHDEDMHEVGRHYRLIIPVIRTPPLGKAAVASQTPDCMQAL